jgi:phospholipid-binding lipoprotein MlaA
MRRLALVVAALCLAGCAAVPPDEDGPPHDPYESTNRELFTLNQRFDSQVLHPVAAAYNDTVPGPVRSGLHNVLTTANLPVVFANDLLQARLADAGETLTRFSVNATFGIAGLNDTASDWGMADHGNDFGQTLAAWGWRQPPYLVVPMIGPSNPRDAIGVAGDIALDPSFIVQYKNYVWWVTARKALTILDFRSRTLELTDEVERNSIDYYAAMRSLYVQHRNSEIEGKTP